MVLPSLLAVKGFLSKAWPFLLAGVVALVLLLTYCEGKRSGAAKADKARLEANEKAIVTDSAAKEKAAEERITDERSNQKLEKELTDAVKDLPDAMPSDRRIARACAQLRSQGTSEVHLPARCRSGG